MHTCTCTRTYQVALSLSPIVFTPGELAINGYLYIVHRGIALYGGRVLTSGKVRDVKRGLG